MSEMDRLSILHVAAPDIVGGLESVVQGLAVGHYRMGHRVGVAAVVGIAQDRHPFLDPLIEARVEVFPIRLRRRAYPRERRVVGEICRHFRPDVVHTHGYRPDVLDAAVARGLGVPTITTVHGSSRIGGMSPMYEWIQRKVLRKFDAVVAVSHPIAEGLRRDGISAKRIHIVPNCLTETFPCLDREEARHVLKLPLSHFVVGWVGRLIHAKGADVFIDALTLVDDLPLSVSILGDGVERPRLEARARSIGLNGRISFHGRVDKAAQLFSAFDLFVLSSRTEGTPNTLFEAIAAGVPIVATKVGGVPDVISENEGLLIPPEDPIGLAAAIRAVYANPLGARERATAAQRRMDTHFSSKLWLSRYEELYRIIQRSQ